jgi:tetratricopeptide (TPR) repeat protein
VVAMQSGDRAGVEAAIAETRGLVGLGSAGRLPRVFSAMWQAMVDLVDGRFDEAEANAAELLEMAPLDVNFQNSWAALAFRIGLERGNAADFLPVVREAVEQTPGLVALQTALARALVAGGDLDEARAIVARLARDGFAGVPRDIAFTASLAELTDTCAVLGERDAASGLRRLLLPYSGQLQVTAWGVQCLGAVDRYLAMTELVLGMHDEGEAHFRAALELEDGFGARSLGSRTRLWFARLLVDRDAPGDPEQAADLLREAGRTARSIGQAEVAAEAAALSEGLGVEVR